eukprot:6212341-Pleurochrysis_carterae.AAC.6
MRPCRRRARSLQTAERLCSKERERGIKILRLATPELPSKILKPHNHSGSSPAPTINMPSPRCKEKYCKATLTYWLIRPHTGTDGQLYGACGIFGYTGRTFGQGIDFHAEHLLNPFPFSAY